MEVLLDSVDLSCSSHLFTKCHTILPDRRDFSISAGDSRRPFGFICCLIMSSANVLKHLLVLYVSSVAGYFCLHVAYDSCFEAF